MPIAPYRHNLPKTADGEHIFIIQTPMPYTGKKMGVHFIEGEGRTRHYEKARRFDDWFGYTVILPDDKAVEPWELVGASRAVRDVERFETELAGRYEDEDGDERGWSKVDAVLPEPKVKARAS